MYINFFLVLGVFQRDQIMSIRRNISTVPSLMKQNLRNQHHADISVMAATRKQVTHLLRINVVQVIVQDHEARFCPTRVLLLTKLLRFALVIFGIFAGQLLTLWNSGLLAVTPYYTAAEFFFGAECVEVL